MKNTDKFYMFTHLTTLNRTPEILMMSIDCSKISSSLIKGYIFYRYLLTKFNAFFIRIRLSPEISFVF